MRGPKLYRVKVPSATRRSIVLREQLIRFAACVIVRNSLGMTNSSPRGQGWCEMFAAAPTEEANARECLRYLLVADGSSLLDIPRGLL